MGLGGGGGDGGLSVRWWLGEMIGATVCLFVVAWGVIVCDVIAVADATAGRDD